ncbi:MAG: phosphatidylglycerol lysyltransferase domain-containing protein [Clostridiales bacterium]|jgi:hypothetical protein|nr:phosphatidylglycerol lysyltransferase domain-containing protein [Clostridiales bacterium]
MGNVAEMGHGRVLAPAAAVPAAPGAAAGQPAGREAPPLRFSHIRLADRERFDALFAAAGPQISDLTFSNLLMWRRMINFRVAWHGGFACILAIPYKYPPYMYAPVGAAGIGEGVAVGAASAAASIAAGIGGADAADGAVGIGEIGAAVKIGGVGAAVGIGGTGAASGAAGFGGIGAAGFEDAVRKCVEFFRWKGWAPRFRCVPAGAAQAVESAMVGCGCKPRREEDRDFFDYVYLASDLIGLRGKKFDGKRNHINKFRKMYDYEYEKLAPSHIDECLRIMYDRCVENDCGCLRGKFYSCDRKPSMELLSNYGSLGCTGAVIKVNGRCEAFTVGEALNADTAVIYIEKANASIQGLYSFINQQFCEREWSGMTYINREEDEGVEGLRKAKLSYHPVRLVEKYTISDAAGGA